MRDTRWIHKLTTLLILGILLWGFWLRVYCLDVQSFAFDEGWTSYAIHHAWDKLFAVLAPDNHPPLYYVLVKALADLAGYSDWTLRFFSVICGTSLIALLYAFGKRTGGTVAGVGAAVTGALSPLLVYYAQEARMYSLLMALAVLSSYTLARLADQSDSRGWQMTYLLSTSAALYTHYFAALLVLTQNVAVGIWALVTRNRQRLGRWVMVQGLMVILYLPWLGTAVRQIAIGQGTWWRVPLPPKVIARDLWRFFTLGPRRPSGVPLAGSMLGGVLLAVLVAALLGWRRRFGMWAYVLATMLAQVAIIVGLGSTLPLYTDRYALIAAPGLPIAVGVGASACWYALQGKRAWLGRVAATSLVVAAVAGPLPQLRSYYHDPKYWREDFERAAHYAMETSGRGDVVILVGSYQPVMQYYEGPAKVVRFPLQGDSVRSEERVAERLNEAIGRDSQVRVIMYSWPTVDPQGLVEGMLRAHCRLQGEHWQQETGQRPIKVLNFEGCAPLVVEPRVPANAIFGEQIALVGYRLIRFTPGRQAHAFLWWKALRRPQTNYSAFVHVVGSDGEILTQFDHLPLSDFYPMRAWEVGVELRDDYPLNIPNDISLDGAWLAVGLYDRSSGVRLDVKVDGQSIGDFVRIPLE